MLTAVLYHHSKLQYLRGIFKKSNSPKIIAILPKENYLLWKSFLVNKFLLKDDNFFISNSF